MSSELPLEAPLDILPSNEPAASLSTQSAGISDEGHADTQRSLQQASVALEVTLSRIGEVRRSLLRLSESLPNSESMPRLNQGDRDIGPAHEALLLSGGDRNDADTMRRTAFNRFTTYTEATSAVGATGNPVEAEPRRVATTHWRPGRSRPIPESSTTSSPSTLNRPNFGRSWGEISNPRRSAPSLHELQGVQYTTWRDGPLDRRSLPPDSAATTRGLRVAAREASASVVRDTISPPTVVSVPGQSRWGYQPPAGSSYHDTIPELADSDNDQPPLDAERGPFGYRGRNSVDASTRRPTPTNTVVGNQHFQSLSGAPNVGRIRYIPTLSPNYSTNPPSENAAAMPDMLGHYLQMQEDFRTDALGNNSDDFDTWLFPHLERRGMRSVAEGTAEQRQRLDVIRQDINSLRQNIDMMRFARNAGDHGTIPERTVAQRRGWARLDADGNEISPAEEDELERARTEYRIRALHQAGHMVNNSTPAPRLPQSNISDDHNALRASFGSVLDSTLAVPNPQRLDHAPDGNVATPPATSLYVDPLPMPLASMEAQNHKQGWWDVAPRVIIPKNACLAGR